MISSLKGTVEALGSDWVVVNVSGVGFRVYVPTSLLGRLGKVGSEVALHTHLHVTDDSLALYGFASPEDVRLFESLLGVSGLGPRLALAILSALTAEQVTMAIATGSADLLMSVPGVGKKTASRVVLELRDRIGAGLAIAPAEHISGENAEVLAALTSLGYSVAEASRAVASLPSGASLAVEERVRLALQYLGTSP